MTSEKNVDQKIVYGTSLPATVNDIAFALETMKQAGFVIRQPVGVDLREVACQVLGIDDDDDVEALVSQLAQAIEIASVSMPPPAVLPIGLTRPQGKFDIRFALGFEQLTNQVQAGGDKPTSLLHNLTNEQRQALEAWADRQTPSAGGSVDLKRWPGWAEALQANIQSK